MNRTFGCSQARPRATHCPSWIRAGSFFFSLSFLLVVATQGRGAQFRGLEQDLDYENPFAISVEQSGGQILGMLTPTSSAGAGTLAAVWDEVTHEFSFVGPVPAAARRSKAVSQATALDRSTRLTFGSIEPADANLELHVWVQTEDLQLGTVTSATLSPYPSAAAANEAVAISRHGHRLINYGPTGGQVAAFFDPVSGGYTDLDDIVARGMDDGGTRVVGFGRDGAVDHAGQAVLWSAATQTVQELGPLTGGGEAAALGISHSGRIVVGESESTAVGGGLREAFRWHPDIGMQALEPIANGASRESAALATSDGNVVVGRYWDDDGQTFQAFMWTPSGGRVDLKTFLTDDMGLGAELDGWSLTEAVSISADGQVIAGNGLNPDGDSQGWVVDFTDRNVAEVIVRVENSNDRWEVLLECGDEPISDLYFGLIAPDSFPYDGTFDFAGCEDSFDVQVGGPSPLPLVILDGRSCSNTNPPPEIGASVSPGSYVLAPQELGGMGADTARANTFYFGIFGDGGPDADTLCERGDPEFVIGVLELDAGGGPVELIPSPYTPSIGSNPRGDLIADDQFRLRREFPSPSPSIFVEREIREILGARWLVSLNSPIAFSKFSFGIIIPPTGEPVSFGDCNLDLEGVPRSGQGRRGCVDGESLGPWVDFSSVRTVGPSPELAEFGMRPDTLYVYLEGDFSGPGALEQLNAANGNMKLGEFSFDGQLSNFPAYVPALTFEGVENFDLAWGDAADWADLDGNPPQYGAKMAGSKSASASKSGGGMGGETGFLNSPATETGDSDGIADNMDNCPYVDNPTLDDNGTLQVMDGAIELVDPGQKDGIGDVCQCGEAEDNASVIMDDVYDLRSALASSTEAAKISSGSKSRCNAIGVVSTTIDSVTGLAEDCDINDVFVILKGREGEAPLHPISPLNPPACPSN